VHLISRWKQQLKPKTKMMTPAELPETKMDTHEKKENKGKFKKDKNKKSGGEVGQISDRRDGYVPILKSAISGVTLLVRPARSFYLVDVHALFILAFDFGNCVVRWSRRGGWENFNYYAALFLWGIGAKLQRVGIATDQIQPNNNEVMSVQGLSLPATMVMLINQLGMKTDADKVVLAPLVTNDLIRSIASVAVDLSAGVGVFGPHAFSIMNRLAYGNMAIRNVIMMKVAEQCDVPFVTMQPANRFDVGVANMIDDYKMKIGMGPLTAGQRAALLVPAGVGNSYWDGYLSHGAARVPFAGPLAAGFPINAVGYLDNEFDHYSTPHPIGANFVAGFPLMGNTVFPGIDAAVFECSEIAQHCVMANLPVSPDGSFAPLCKVRGQSEISMSTYIRDVTPAEYILGCALNMDCYLCKVDRVPFTGHNKLARAERYTTSILPFTVSELRAILFREMTQRN